MLTSLTDQARTTTIRWWKWILAALIAIAAAFLAWRLRKRAVELLALRTEYAILCDCLEDLKVRAAATHAKLAIDAAQRDILSGGLLTR